MPSNAPYYWRRGAGARRGRAPSASPTQALPRHYHPPTARASSAAFPSNAAVPAVRADAGELAPARMACAWRQWRRRPREGGGINPSSQLSAASPWYYLLIIGSSGVVAYSHGCHRGALAALRLVSRGARRRLPRHGAGMFCYSIGRAHLLLGASTSNLVNKEMLAALYLRLTRFYGVLGRRRQARSTMLK